MVAQELRLLHARSRDLADARQRLHRILVRRADSDVPDGDGADVELVNAFLTHLSVRNFAPATRRAYAYDLLNFLRFCTERICVWRWSCRWTCSTIWTGRPRRGRAKDRMTSHVVV